MSEDKKLTKEETFTDIDLAYCRKIDTQKEKAIEEIEGFENVVELTLNKSKVGEFNLILDDLAENVFNKIKKHRERINAVLVTKIYNYFNEKYGVKLDSVNLVQKARNDDKKVDYMDCIEDIYDQLNGENFKKLRIQEIKEDFREKIRLRDCKCKLKNNKTRIDNYLYYREHWDGTDKLVFGSEESVLVLFKTLKYFELEETTGYDPSLNILLNNIKKYLIYHTTSSGRKNSKYEHFSKHSIDNDKIQYIRFYKNGRVDIKFKKNCAGEGYGEIFMREFIEYK